MDLDTTTLSPARLEQLARKYKLVYDLNYRLGYFISNYNIVAPKSLEVQRMEEGGLLPKIVDIRTGKTINNTTRQGSLWLYLDKNSKLLSTNQTIESINQDIAEREVFYYKINLYIYSPIEGMQELVDRQLYKTISDEVGRRYVINTDLSLYKSLVYVTDLNKNDICCGRVFSYFGVAKQELYEYSYIPNIKIVTKLSKLEIILLLTDKLELWEIGDVLKQRPYKLISDERTNSGKAASILVGNRLYKHTSFI